MFSRLGMYMCSSSRSPKLPAQMTRIPAPPPLRAYRKRRRFGVGRGCMRLVLLFFSSQLSNDHRERSRAAWPAPKLISMVGLNAGPPADHGPVLIGFGQLRHAPTAVGEGVYRGTPYPNPHDPSFCRSGQLASLLHSLALSVPFLAQIPLRRINNPNKYTTPLNSIWMKGVDCPDVAVVARSTTP